MSEVDPQYGEDASVKFSEIYLLQGFAFVHLRIHVACFAGMYILQAGF
jgi:hypothetical protein